MTALNTLMTGIADFARDKMPKDILHGWPHIQRVLAYARMVNAEMHARWDIIECSVLFHDAGHSIRRKDHNMISAEIASDYLDAKKIDRTTISLVRECIVAHSRQFSETLPESPEAKVVYDADGMDLFGPIGLLRALLSCGLEGKGFPCILEKLQWRSGQKNNFYSTIAAGFAHKNSAVIESYYRGLEEQLRLFEHDD
ncbi:MAG: HD domain-containing protein [Spirochaetales bacterium]|nr:HD domain-containing protein [Spirochaetales bacterium]